MNFAVSSYQFGLSNMNFVKTSSHCQDHSRRLKGCSRCIPLTTMTGDRFFIALKTRTSKRITLDIKDLGIKKMEIPNKVSCKLEVEK